MLNFSVYNLCLLSIILQILIWRLFSNELLLFQIKYIWWRYIWYWLWLFLRCIYLRLVNEVIDRIVLYVSIVVGRFEFFFLFGLIDHLRGLISHDWFVRVYNIVNNDRRLIDSKINKLIYSMILIKEVK